VTVAIIGRTSKGLTAAIVPAGATLIATTAAAARNKVRAAATVNPDAIAVPSPRLPLGARRAASLLYKLDASSCIGIAILASSIVGRAGNRLACIAAAIVPAWATLARTPVATTTSAAARNEVRTAATVNPDSVAVPSPCLAFRARRATSLSDKLRAAARVSVAVVALSIVGRAGNRLAYTDPAHVTASARNKVGAAATVNPDSVAIPSPRLSLSARRAAALSN
jgi:hypothetical protein